MKVVLVSKLYIHDSINDSSPSKKKKKRKEETEEEEKKDEEEEEEIEEEREAEKEEEEGEQEKEEEEEKKRGSKSSKHLSPHIRVLSPQTKPCDSHETRTGFFLCLIIKQRVFYPSGAPLSNSSWLKTKQNQNKAHKLPCILWWNITFLHMGSIKSNIWSLWLGCDFSTARSDDWCWGKAKSFPV